MNKDKMIFGENAVFSMDSSKTGVNNNVLVVGSTGCGKTMSISEPQLLETESSSLIVTLTKRTLADKYTELFRKRGYAAETLDFTAPLKGTVAFDPMKYIRTDKDASALAEAIVLANPRKSASSADPYWDDSSRMLLCAEMGIARYKAALAGRKPTFSDVLKIHSELDISWGFRDEFTRQTSFDTVIDDMSCDKKYSSAVRGWCSVKDLPRKTLSCIIGTLSAALETMFTDELRQSMDSLKSLDFRSLGKGKTVLFVITSPVNKVLNRFVSLFYSAAFKELFELAEGLPSGRLPVPVHIICDDFATGAAVPNFAQYISIFRAKGISVTLLIQSESQLIGLYGLSDAKTIINNCDTYIYMGGMDIETCSSISARMNIPFEDVMYMPLGQVCVMRRGRRPLLTKRYNITADPRYIKLEASRILALSKDKAL